MADTPDPIQELLIQARRTQILDAATQVFAEKGFHRATIKDIARTAGVADGTIYTYFPSKTEVLLGILNRLNESSQRQEYFETGGEEDARSFFTATMRKRIGLIWPNIEVFRAVLPELLVNRELRNLYYQQVIAPTLVIAERYYEGQKQKGRIQEVDIALTVRAITGTILGSMVLQMLGDEVLANNWERLPEALTGLLFDGLANALEEND